MIVIQKNNKAYFEYTVIEKFVAGIQLAGSEVKAVKAARVSIAEAFCIIQDGEIFINQMHITESKQNTMLMHDPVRPRKLLLNKNEIHKLEKEIKEKGLTIVPLAILLTKTGYVKVEIGLVRGKKLFDKRESIKEKDLKREMGKKF